MIKNKFSDHMVDSYIKCDICNSVFKHKRTLKSHIASIHERRKPFQCNTCHSSFQDNCSLKRHIASVHDKIKPFQCNICDSSFAEKNKLERHIASVHERRKSFQCKTCNTSFAEKSKLKYHIESAHEKRKPFPCNTCHSSFRDYFTLEKHIASVHDNYCNVSFTGEKNLITHVAEDHEKKNLDAKILEFKTNIKPDPESKQPFSCPVCQSAFTCEKNLRIHLHSSTFT